MWATCRVCWTFSFHSVLSSFLMSNSSSSRSLAIPARSSSLAIQYGSSYSFPSSKGPIFRPTSWISGWLRLTIMRTCEFSKTKSMSRMGECAFTVVNLNDVSPFSVEKDCLKEKCVWRFKVSSGNGGFSRVGGFNRYM